LRAFGVPDFDWDAAFFVDFFAAPGFLAAEFFAAALLTVDRRFVVQGGSARL
jgi:hypothetical protein